MAEVSYPESTIYSFSPWLILKKIQRSRISGDKCYDIDGETSTGNITYQLVFKPNTGHVNLQKGKFHFKLRF